MIKRKFCYVVVSLFMACAVTFGSCSLAIGKRLQLTLIETSDVHGSFFPFDFIENKAVNASLAQVHTYVKEQRARTDRKVILMDNGDILQGQPTVYYHNFEKTGAPHICSAIMNFMAYDVAAVGNHDIETGHDVYDRLAKEFDFPWLAANAVKSSDGTPYFEPYTVIEINGVKIAILGLVTPGIPKWLPQNLWEGMRFEDMVESAKKWVRTIEKKEHPDLLVGLFHAGAGVSSGDQQAARPMNENASRIVAESIPGFDLVFVGHDHKGWNKKVKNIKGEEVLIVGASNAARTAGVAHVTMTYDEAEKTWMKDMTGEIIETEAYKPDAEFLTRFEDMAREVKAYVSKPIGRITETMSTREAIFGDSPFVDLIHEIQLELTGADVSFAAPLSFDKAIREGTVYVRDMFKLYKYENLLYTMSLTGKEIKDFLEYSCGLWFNRMKKADDHLIAFKRDEKGAPIWSRRYHTFETMARYYNYDSAAGIVYTVDVSKPVGERITIHSMADGSPFAMNKVYRVAINSFRGSGGGGHLTRGAGIPEQDLGSWVVASTIKDLRYFMMKWIEEKQIFRPKAFGNWNVISYDWWAKARAMDYQLLYETGFEKP